LGKGATGLLNPQTLEALEFEAIRALLLKNAGSALGRERVKSLGPQCSAEAVREEIARTVEGVALLGTLGRQSYELPDPRESLRASKIEGFGLEPSSLLEVASFAEAAHEIASRVAPVEIAPRLAHRARQIQDLTDLARLIRHAIHATGEISDEASPLLADTRRSLVRLKARLTSVMEAFLDGREADRILQDKLITTRNERYVLILKAEHRGRLAGIIHGMSSSGASLFVEPLPAVELNNDIVSLQDAERREVRRILQGLTAEVGLRAEALAEAARILGELDEVQARALLAQQMDAAAPEIVDEPRIALNAARHPLLMSDLTERLGLPPRTALRAVPVSIEVSQAARVLVISGPNTGGKTVALKTVGLLALMAQSGLLIPAAPGSVLPAFKRIFADIGDDQSIAANLSTFSAHLKSVLDMIRNLSLPALVLLDEIGGGTDPTEGGALGVAVIDDLGKRGAMVVATTHNSLLKAYAQSTEGVACASFGYNPDSYEPSYELILGKAGRSLAFEMAERLGVPASIVSDARSRLETKEAQAEALLRTLEKERGALKAAADRLVEDRRALDGERERQSILMREAESAKRSEIEAFVADLRRRGEEAARRAADAIQDAVRRVEGSRASEKDASRARARVVRTLKEVEESTVSDLAAPMQPASRVVVGDRVRVVSLGIVGHVTSTDDPSELEIACLGKRLFVPRSKVCLLSETRGKARSEGLRPDPKKVVPAELNVVGLSVDEAIPRVDKILDDAVLSESRQIRVVHGLGKGLLRSAVARLLEGHPHVAAYRAASLGEGGGAVTIVDLKE